VRTILSQNTNDINRDRGFDKLIETYPEWDLVRKAPAEDVQDAIRVSGLASRKGPSIQNALQKLKDDNPKHIISLEYLFFYFLLTFFFNLLVFLIQKLIKRFKII
jgi:endonuclease-3